MHKNVKFENELYNPMKNWLHTYLSDNYKRSDVHTFDTHLRSLDDVLTEFGIIDKYPQTVGLGIQIDVLGIISEKERTSLVFIEAKKTKLNLHDLGQLWAYCKLCDPLEAFLLSSVGLGSLDKILNNLSRTDLLTFGEGKKIKKMQVAKWNIYSNAIDPNTLVPKI